MMSLDYTILVAFVTDTIQDFVMSVERRTAKLKMNRFYDEFGLHNSVSLFVTLFCYVDKLDYFVIRLAFLTYIFIKKENNFIRKPCHGQRGSLA